MHLEDQCVLCPITGYFPKPTCVLWPGTLGFSRMSTKCDCSGLDHVNSCDGEILVAVYSVFHNFNHGSLGSPWPSPSQLVASAPVKQMCCILVKSRIPLRMLDFTWCRRSRRATPLRVTVPSVKRGGSEGFSTWRSIFTNSSE